MTKNKELISNYQELENPEKVRLGDGRTVDAIGVGNNSLADGVQS